MRIALGIWWDGSHIPDDALQCNAYLVEAGAQSVLIDPGSALVADRTLDKIRQVIPVDRIKYFVCQHSDPDIIGTLPIILDAARRKDATLVMHWRSEMLAKHLGLGLPFWRIEEHGWTLNANGRSFDFVLTPYLHFPGAFCTLDRRTKTLFTSDLFGAMSDDWSLFAKDASHFEAVRNFHEHYMPSREILASGLASIEKFPIRLIAPQHGSIIRAPLIRLMFNRLKSLDCGIYQLARHDTRIRRLMEINAIQRKIGTAIVVYRDFASVAAELREAVGRVLPLKSIEFWSTQMDGQVGEAMQFAPQPHYRGEIVPLPK